MLFAPLNVCLLQMVRLEGGEGNGNPAERGGGVLGRNCRTDKLDDGITTWYHSRVLGIHHETLSHIFNKRIGGMRSWDLTVSMLKALGAHVKEIDRYHIAVELNGIVGIFHRRPPLTRMTKRSVDNMKDLLEKAGVKP